jgi:hypothetical protein
LCWLYKPSWCCCWCPDIETSFICCAWVSSVWRRRQNRFSEM